MRRFLTLLFKLHLTQRLRRLGFRVPWIRDEIEQEWFGGSRLNWDGNEVERAFNIATKIRGLKWVLGNQFNTSALAHLPGIGRLGGYAQFLRVYWFGIRVASILGASGAEKLIERLITEDSDASEEASAIHLLHAGQPDIEVDIEPSVEVGTRSRNPDFRIRMRQQPWVYVEVTKLHSSNASVRVHELLARTADRVMAVEHPFLVEIILNREPTIEEQEVIVTEVGKACEAAGEGSVTVADIASIIVKSDDVRVVAPSPIADDNQPRMALSKAVRGPGSPNRQVIVRVPLADPRAEEILRQEARQLPKNECGLIMVNVNSQPTAFESWSKRVPQRFTPGQHTRVAAVMLFMHATWPTEQGLLWLPSVKLIPNPNAAVPVPSWITERVACIREKTRRLTGRPD
jgi:hypothetical protein